MKLRASEYQIQCAIVDYLTPAERSDALRFFHIPNGGARNPITGARLKRIGVKKGAPDLCILMANGDTVWVEVKADKGRLTKEQKEFGEWLHRPNVRQFFFVVRSVDELHNQLVEWCT